MSLCRARAAPAGLLGVAAISTLGCTPIAVDAFEPIDCNAVPFSERCRFNYWPNPVSSTNSDPWLVAHHDALLEIRPRVLVLNFDNLSPGDAINPAIETQIKALAEGSRYHGYSDPLAPPFIEYEIADVVDLTDADPSASNSSSSTRVPVDLENRFEAQRLFSNEFQFPDPTDPERNVGLCELFESGAVNEVWLAVADGMREPPLMTERKQVYDPSFSALSGQFNACGGTSECLEVECGVTLRLAHLNPRRGAGCDLQVRGWAIVDMGAAIPYFAENAAAFFNADFRSRFGASFDSFSEYCEGAEPCVSYPSSTVAAPAGTDTWRFDPYRQGCGTPEFPPNATARYDWRSSTPVESRCEHYGLRDGEDGDLYEPYDAATKLAVYADLLPEDAEFPLDCGGGWQMYWRQSMPGRGNLARGADGEPMKNWWPFLFY